MGENLEKTKEVNFEDLKIGILWNDQETLDGDILYSLHKFEREMTQKGSKIKNLKMKNLMKEVGYNEWPLAYPIFKEMEKYFNESQFDVSYHQFFDSPQTEFVKNYFQMIKKNKNYLSQQYPIHLEMRASLQQKLDNYFIENNCDLLGSLFYNFLFIFYL